MKTIKLALPAVFCLALVATSAEAANHSARSLKDYRAAYKAARARFGNYQKDGYRYHLVKATRQGVYLVAEQTRGNRDAKVLLWDRSLQRLTLQNQSQNGQRVVAGSAIATLGEALERAAPVLRMDQIAGRGGRYTDTAFKGIGRVKNQRGNWEKVFVFAKTSEPNQKAYIAIDNGALVKMVDGRKATYGGAANFANNR